MIDTLKQHGRIMRLKRKFPGMELQLFETMLVADCLLRRGPCNFLVFGMGNDSALWRELNEGGRTVFLEDHEEWFSRIKALQPDMEAYLVNYTTRLPEWRAILKQPERLEMALPDKIVNTSWHVILVDGPKADPYHFEKYGVHPPGRMQSIFMASRLSSPGGDVLVHDCDRLAEVSYAEEYLGQENLRKTVKGRAVLKHFQMP